MDRDHPPPIPLRHRQQNGRRQSVPSSSAPSGPSDSNRFHVQPASPEVISSLITSLSIISSPANRLFEHSSTHLSPPTSPLVKHESLVASQRNSYNNGDMGGSFGIDYGAFKQPSLDERPEEGPLDELAASFPVIRTAKPPSGFSSLTAPKSPSKDGTIKQFLRGSSRPSSVGSLTSKEKDVDHDDVISIGSLSIEPGVAPPQLKRRSSTDSWGKKQARNSKGLMYMSSKERLRDSERKRSSGSVVGVAQKAPGADRLSLPQFEGESFMAETPINEETGLEPGTLSPSAARLSDSQLTSAAPSPGIGSVGGTSPALSSSSQGGIGSGRFIPARDSSLRKAPTPKKRHSNRASRQSGKSRENDDETAIPEVDELQPRPRDRSNENKRRDRGDYNLEPSTKLQESLDSPALAAHPDGTTYFASKNAEPGSKNHEKVLCDGEEDGAPSPAIAQRKSRASGDISDLGNKNRDSHDLKQNKRDSKHKRLSAPLSPTRNEKDSHQRSVSQPLGRKEVISPEPFRNPQVNIDDRPSSADSIDDAVDAYLRSPRLSQKIRHPQTGRIISFSEVGDSEGFAVFCCVGMGLTRYITAFYDELALTLKLRLITPDRPGVGNSEPYTDGTATPLSWPDDVYTICQTLKITKFSILAHSAGAIYALATALRMPQHIRGRIHLLAPWIPPSQMNVSGAKQALPPTNSIPTSQRILRALPTPILKAANSSFMSATSTSITSSLPKSPRRNKRKSTNGGRETPAPSGRTIVAAGSGDKENHGPAASVYAKPNSSTLDATARDSVDPNSEAAILAAAANTIMEKERQVTYDTRLTHAIWDLATSGANPAVDLLVCLERRHTIGFRYVDITRAVVIHHGTKDTRVPVENVKWLGKMMRRCEVRILEGEGHGLMASAGVMGGVLMEIAREWEDWVSITEQKPHESRSRALRERASVGAFR